MFIYDSEVDFVEEISDAADHFKRLHPGKLSPDHKCIIFFFLGKTVLKKVCCRQLSRLLRAQPDKRCRVWVRCLGSVRNLVGSQLAGALHFLSQPVVTIPGLWIDQIQDKLLFYTVQFNGEYISFLLLILY